MLKIRSKLFLSFVLMTLVIITAVGFLLNLSFQEKFAQYLQSNLQQRHQSVIDYIAKVVDESGMSPTFFMNMAHLSAMESVRVLIYQPAGQLIFDSAKEMAEMEGHAQGGNVPAKAYSTQQMLQTKKYRLKVIITSELPGGVWSPNDITFRQALRDTLVWSLVIGFLLAVGFSLYISSKITQPVTDLKNAAVLISRGDWKARVKIKSRDELEDLGDSFNKMAEDLEHLENLRRQMTADLAHELRNPLMSIQSYIEGMLDHVIEADEDNLVDLHEEVTRLTELINNLQRLAQLEANRRLNPSQILFGKEFQPYFERIKLEFDKKHVLFSWKINLEEGVLDKFMLKEILQNLLENALKYTLEGGSVHCSMEKANHAGKAGLSIIVVDTGIGIGEKDLPYIFERFYRGGDPSRARQTGGTGIGLAITQELVQLSGGEIVVESKLDEGSRFTVFLPFFFDVL